MTIAENMLQEFEEQVPVTRKFLERLPEDKLMWKPHEKSMTAGQLAYHIAFVPGGIAQFVANSPAQAPEFGKFPQPASKKEILDTFDQGVATAKSTIRNWDDAKMQETWRLMAGDKEVLAVPRMKFMRDIMLNHWYQHRGQFCVYLRLLGAAVPASWGPSADEPPAFLQRAQSA